MNGAADLAATIVIACIALWGGYRLLLWLAGRVIAAIDFMTRYE